MKGVPAAGPIGASGMSQKDSQVVGETARDGADVRRAPHESGKLTIDERVCNKVE